MPELEWQLKEIIAAVWQESRPDDSGGWEDIGDDVPLYSIDQSEESLGLDSLDALEIAMEILERHLVNLRENRKISELIKIPVPRDQTKQYDRVIAMMEDTSQGEVELSGREYAQYMMDDWDWKSDFLASTVAYSETARRMSEEWEE